MKRLVMSFTAAIVLSLAYSAEAQTQTALSGQFSSSETKGDVVATIDHKSSFEPWVVPLPGWFPVGLEATRLDVIADVAYGLSWDDREAARPKVNRLDLTINTYCGSAFYGVDVQTELRGFMVPRKNRGKVGYEISHNGLSIRPSLAGEYRHQGRDNDGRHTSDTYDTDGGLLMTVEYERQLFGGLGGAIATTVNYFEGVGGRSLTAKSRWTFFTGGSLRMWYDHYYDETWKDGTTRHHSLTHLLGMGYQF